MKSFHFLLTALLGALLLSCDTAPAAAPAETSLEDLGPNAAIIRNPVDQGAEKLDTANMARMAFTETDFQFGTVEQGAVVTHAFDFVNTGKAPLLITTARSTCGCTVSDHPEAPIAPGESGTISVAFDTKNKDGGQRKPVIITANTYPATTTIYVSGTVTTNKK